VNRPKIIETVDALAGSGKTFGAIRWALLEATVKRQKTAIVLKSKELIQQAYRDALDFNRQRNLGVPVKAIHSDLAHVRNRTESVSNLVQAHLDGADQSTGEVLMLTEAALLTNHHWPNRYRWVLICDEIPEVAPSIKANLPDNHHLLTQHLRLVQSDAKYSELGFQTGGKQALIAIAENRNDDEVNEVLSSMAARLVSPIYQNHVLTEQFNNLLKGKAEQFEVFSLLQPSVFGHEAKRTFETTAGGTGQADLAFKHVIVMGAAFDKSLMRRIWPGLGVEFVPHAQISRNLRYREHSCGPRLKIQYVFDADWSKYFANQTSILDGNETTNFDVLSQACRVAFGEEPFVYLINKDREGDFAELYEGQGKQLCNAPWGLNRYQGFHNAAVLSALNPTSSHLGFLQSFVDDKGGIRDALFHSHVYQAVMRTSLRTLDAEESVTVVLPDRKSAAALAEFFPGCRWSKLPLDLQETCPKEMGRPVLVNKKSRAEINKDAAARRKAIKAEIQWLEDGGDVRVERVAKLRGECKRSNANLVRLEALVAQAKTRNAPAAE